jgi:LacI family transcriptional regulator
MIAAELGVSVSTVSLSLNGHPSIPEATRDKVIEAARRLGYEPDANFSRLMSYLRGAKQNRDLPVIAYVHNAPQREFWRFNPYNRQLVEGLHRRANDLGYKVEAFWISEKSGYTLRNLPRILRARGIESVILDPHDNADYSDFDLTHFACAATCAYDPARLPIHRATVYREETVFASLNHLHKQGYRRIGFVIWHFDKEDLNHIRPYLSAFLAYQAIDVPPEHRVPVLFTHSMGAWDESAARKWLLDHQPDLILALDLRIRDTIDSLGLRIPQDIAYAYMDWVPEQVPLAGINNFRDRTAAQAIELIDSQIRRNERGYPDLAKVVFIKGNWGSGDTVPEPAIPRP